MRIISGQFKGKRINPPKNFKARPTTDFAKENLFNLLNNYFAFDELSILDLFGGTGSISYEFVSRGCRQIDCVELNRTHCSFIKRTSQELNISDFLKVFNAYALKFVERTEKKYDLIFADPPYNLKDFDTIPGTILNSNCLKPDGWLILEHSDKFSFQQNPHFKEHRSYGGVNFTIFSKKSDFF